MYTYLMWICILHKHLRTQGNFCQDGDNWQNRIKFGAIMSDQNKKGLLTVDRQNQAKFSLKFVIIRYKSLFYQHLSSLTDIMSYLFNFYQFLFIYLFISCCFFLFRKYLLSLKKQMHKMKYCSLKNRICKFSLNTIQN